MTDFRTAIVCVSRHHGNAMQVAEAIAGVLHAEILAPELLPAIDVSHYGVLGWESGIYFCRHHQSLLRLAESKAILPKKAFVFSTAGLPQLSWLWHASLRNRLRNQGREILGE